MNFNPFNSSVSEILAAIEKQNAWQKDIAKSITISASVAGLTSQLSQFQQIQAQFPKNSGIFKSINNISEMTRYLENHKSNYTSFLSGSRSIADMVASSAASSIPQLNLWSSGIGSILNKISHNETIKPVTALDTILAGSFINLSNTLGNVPAPAYEEAISVLNENEEIKTIIQETLTSEAVASLASPEGYKNLESLLGEKLSSINGISLLVKALILFIVLQMAATIIKKETEIFIYGDSTKKIITAINQGNEKTQAHLDSVIHAFENKQPIDVPFTLHTRHDCKMFTKNSLSSKVLYGLKKGDEVVVRKEFRKWIQVEIKTDAGAVTGFVPKRDLKEH